MVQWCDLPTNLITNFISSYVFDHTLLKKSGLSGIGSVKPERLVYNPIIREIGNN